MTKMIQNYQHKADTLMYLMTIVTRCLITKLLKQAEKQSRMTINNVGQYIAMDCKMSQAIVSKP
jgi:hypothetical protein